MLNNPLLKLIYTGSAIYFIWITADTILKIIYKLNESYTLLDIASLTFLIPFNLFYCFALIYLWFGKHD